MSMCINVDLLMPSYFPPNTSLIDSGPLMVVIEGAFSIKYFTQSFSHHSRKSDSVAVNSDSFS